MHHRRLDFHEATRRRFQPLAHEADDLRARDKGAARLFGHDQVDIALTVTLLHVGQAMKFIWQRTQALGQQAQAVGTHGELAGLGAHQHAFGADDVADVPTLEGFVRLAHRALMDEQLDAPGVILQLHEADLALHALEHDASGHLHPPRCRLDRFGRLDVLISELGLQIAAKAVDLEVVRKRDALPAQRGQFLATLGDQLVFVLDRRIVVVTGHS